jgi:hypothetical protein
VNNIEEEQQQVQAATEQTPAPEITHVMFDLDNCLFVMADQVDKLSALPNNLTLIEIDYFGKINRYYAINLEAMRLIMAALIGRGIKIGFITNSGNKGTILKPFFEKLYLLETGTFDDSLYINLSNYSWCGLSKGGKLLAAKGVGKFANSLAAQILVLDDAPTNVTDIKSCGFSTIHTCGFPLSNNQLGIPMPLNNDYLLALVKRCGLDVDLSPLILEVERHIAIPVAIEMQYDSDDEVTGGKYPQQLAIILKCNSTLKIYKLLKDMKWNELSTGELESLLEATAKAEHANHYKQWQDLIFNIFGCLARKTKWENYKLNINNSNLWALLDDNCVKYALNMYPESIADILDAWGEAHYGKLESLEHGASIVLCLEKKLIKHVPAFRHDPKSKHERNFKAMWQFIARFACFNILSQHVIFNYSATHRRKPDAYVVELCPAILDNALKYDALQAAAQYMNAELILQFLLCKYYHANTNSEFLPACDAALKIFTENKSQTIESKAAELSLLLAYLSTFWTALDETTLYANLKKYVQAQLVLEPDLLISISLQKHGLTLPMLQDETETPRCKLFSSNRMN